MEVPKTLKGRQNQSLRLPVLVGTATMVLLPVLLLPHHYTTTTTITTTAGAGAGAAAAIRYEALMRPSIKLQHKDSLMDWGSLMGCERAWIPVGGSCCKPPRLPRQGP